VVIHEYYRSLQWYEPGQAGYISYSIHIITATPAIHVRHSVFYSKILFVFKSIPFLQPGGLMFRHERFSHQLILNPTFEIQKVQAHNINFIV
jgi:hypothetical protein